MSPTSGRQIWLKDANLELTLYDTVLYHFIWYVFWWLFYVLRILLFVLVSYIPKVSSAKLTSYHVKGSMLLEKKNAGGRAQPFHNTNTIMEI